jgi:beta-phosphoglucomutase
LFATYAKHRGVVTRVTLWGVTDKNSWKNDWPVKGRTNYPPLFDRSGRQNPLSTPSSRQHRRKYHQSTVCFKRRRLERDRPDDGELYVCVARAVLWDMDGTLVDSEELHWRAWRETMADEGISITHDQFLSSFGQRNDSIIPLWLGAGAAPERVRKIESAKEDRFRRLVRDDGVLPLPGAVAWVNRLSESGWLQAVASSAPRANVEAVLGEMGTASYFQAIVSAEDVRRGKPDPEVFLLAASRLGAPPDRCIVVEDAAAGLEGARRAGMFRIGVNRSGSRLVADLVVASLDQLEAHAFDNLVPLRQDDKEDSGSSS